MSNLPAKTPVNFLHAKQTLPSAIATKDRMPLLNADVNVIATDIFSQAKTAFNGGRFNLSGMPEDGIILLGGQKVTKTEVSELETNFAVLMGMATRFSDGFDKLVADNIKSVTIAKVEVEEKGVTVLKSGLIVRTRQSGAVAQNLSTVNVSLSWSNNAEVAINTMLPILIETHDGSQFMTFLVFGGINPARTFTGQLLQFMLACQASGGTLSVEFAEQTIKSGDKLDHKPIVAFTYTVDGKTFKLSTPSRK